MGVYGMKIKWAVGRAFLCVSDRAWSVCIFDETEGGRFKFTELTEGRRCSRWTNRHDNESNCHICTGQRNSLEPQTNASFEARWSHSLSVFIMTLKGFALLVRRVCSRLVGNLYNEALWNMGLSEESSLNVIKIYKFHKKNLNTKNK